MTIPDATARPWSPSDEVELDVRDDLRTGREPFSRILAAVAALGPAQVLHLRTIFEPLPLYRVMASRGYAAEARAHAPDDWSIWFHAARPAADVETADGATADGATADGATADGATADGATADVETADDGTAGGEVRLDVRGLTPPEPLQRTLAALDTLPRDATLVQLNDRVPQFLLPLLHERGFAYTVDRSPADHVIVHIRRAS